MLDQAKILDLVLNALSQLNQELEPAQRIEVSPRTPLFGADAVLDSLQLVSVIVDVETALASELGYPLSLTDDAAISQAVSPFRSPEALSNYIAGRLQPAG